MPSPPDIAKSHKDDPASVEQARKNDERVPERDYGVNVVNPPVPPAPAKNLKS